MNLTSMLANSGIDSVDAGWLKNFLIVVLAIGVPLVTITIAVLVARARKARTIEGQPIGVETVPRRVSKEDLDTLDRKVGQRFDGVEKRIDAMEVQLDEERRTTLKSQSNLHGRVDRVAEAVAGVSGEVKQVDQNVRLLLEKLMTGP